MPEVLSDCESCAWQGGLVIDSFAALRHTCANEDWWVYAEDHTLRVECAAAPAAAAFALKASVKCQACKDKLALLRLADLHAAALPVWLTNRATLNSCCMLSACA